MADAGDACSASISVLSSTSDADLNSPPTVTSLEDCPVEPVHAAVMAVSPENVDVVDKNGNKPDGSLASSKESLTASGSGGCLMTNADSGSVSTTVKPCRVTLTRLKELSSSAAEAAESQPTAEVLEDGQRMDASPTCEQQEVKVEVLVEDRCVGCRVSCTVGTK